MSEIKDFEIEKRLALIADLAEDAQAGIEEMLVPFLLYGLAVPAGTGLSWYLGYIGQGKFIWVLWFVLMAICPLCLNFYYRRISKTKIKRASDTLFSVLWGSITGGIVLSFVLVILEKLTFTAVFFIIALLLAIGCITSGAIIQKKRQTGIICHCRRLGTQRCCLSFCKRQFYRSADYRNSGFFLVCRSRSYRVAAQQKKEAGIT